ncbi:hypothetical protein WUBG_16567 [Wuchereria bancrofti]|uniref:Uncharacterized protein n=1 Tax=Wuchereria bancrofti TaxID=6293 RepID=J9E6A7_WUCBA|nr:hypothetical protein WUBG_16567 [Wuchereria bancrofti]
MGRFSIYCLPFHFESKTSGGPNSPQISSSTDSENLCSDQSAKCQDKLNVSVENEKISNSPLTDNPINISLSSNVSSTMSPTALSITETNSSGYLSPAESNSSCISLQMPQEVKKNTTTDRGNSNGKDNRLTTTYLGVSQPISISGPDEFDIVMSTKVSTASNLRCLDCDSKFFDFDRFSWI